MPVLDSTKRTIWKFDRAAQVCGSFVFVYGIVMSIFGVIGDLPTAELLVLIPAGIFFILGICLIIRLWPRPIDTEKAVKEAMEKAGYSIKRMPNSTDFLFYYQVEVGGVHTAVYQRREDDSIVGIVGQWVEEKLGELSYEDRREYLGDISANLLRMRVQYEILQPDTLPDKQYGFRIEAFIFCDKQTISRDTIFSKASDVICAINLIKLRWSLFSLNARCVD